jgi:hypothetical protein
LPVVRYGFTGRAIKRLVLSSQTCCASGSLVTRDVGFLIPRGQECDRYYDGNGNAKKDYSSAVRGHGVTSEADS